MSTLPTWLVACRKSQLNQHFALCHAIIAAFDWALIASFGNIIIGMKPCRNDVTEMVFSRHWNKWPIWTLPARFITVRVYRL
jgi:hypothetical protein